jgi:tetratricopeptide (TPR) repeat protein
MERYEEALADFSRAIELDAASVWAITSRGETYQAMERYGEALEDFGRAIELDPGLDWAIASRGETYQAMGRYDEALADLSRAIELDPGDDDYIMKRAEIQRHIGPAEPTVLQTVPLPTRLLDLSHISWRRCVADQSADHRIMEHMSSVG